ncbi:MAG: hypothetical protein KAT05_17215 [Spirochaetes bacterium]|nr:hypothetical protein [Spirochaetota bacterium]
MALSKNEIEKIYGIKEKLLITYKAASSEEQKKRISIHLAKIEKIIQNIEEGKWIDTTELHIFSEELKKKEKPDKNNKPTRINYIAKVEILKIAEKNKDSEMDQIYSFIMYFEKNFSIPLGPTYLKLDYYLSRKRELFYAHYEAIKHLLKEYIDDIVLLSELKFNKQIEKYKSRLAQQKKYLFVKLSELLHELKNFLTEIITDFDTGRKSLFNPDEKYVNKFAVDEKTTFEDCEMETIVREAQYFTLDFIEILRMPNFKNHT